MVPAMRRVEAVRLTLTDDGVRAEVLGIGHRHPVTIAVSVWLAARLVEAGAPLEVRSGRRAAVTTGR